MEHSSTQAVDISTPWGDVYGLKALLAKCFFYGAEFADF